MLNLPEKIGVTANLSINYRGPTRADQVASLISIPGSGLIRLFAAVHRDKNPSFRSRRSQGARRGDYGGS